MRVMRPRVKFCKLFFFFDILLHTRLLAGPQVCKRRGDRENQGEDRRGQQGHCRPRH